MQSNAIANISKHLINLKAKKQLKKKNEKENK